jgi:hypothetical protein
LGAGLGGDTDEIIGLGFSPNITIAAGEGAVGATPRDNPGTDLRVIIGSLATDFWAYTDVIARKGFAPNIAIDASIGAIGQAGTG